MKRRLGRNEKGLVRAQYGDNIIFKAINPPAKKLEREMKVLRLSSEEMFLECLTIIDDIKDCDTAKEAEQKVEGLCDTLFCDLREISPQRVSEKELNIAVSEIVNCVVLILEHYRGFKYNGVLFDLLKQLNSGDLNQPDIEGPFSIQFIGVREEISNYIKSYMDSEEYLSDEIKKQLKRIKADEPLPEVEGEEEAEGKLENRQLVILFMELLNVSLDTVHTNQSALAELISRVSGKSKKSLLNTIREGVEYDNSKTKKDAELIASLLDELRSDFAKQIRSNITAE